MRFSQGFNPHPILSLTCPRPVGVATDDDLITFALDEPGDGDDLARRMTDCAPAGMRFDRPVLLQSKRQPQPKRINYELVLGDDDDSDALPARLAELETAETWPVDRVKPPAKRGLPPRRRTIDLRSLVMAVSLDGGVLRWTAEPEAQLWPRADEVLGLLGLDPAGNSARVVRTGVEYDWPAQDVAATQREETHG